MQLIRRRHHRKPRATEAASYAVDMRLTGPDGQQLHLHGSLSSDAAPPDPEPPALSCPVPGDDDTQPGPGQELRAGGPGKFDANGCPTVKAVMTPYWPAPSNADRYVTMFEDTMPDAAAPWPLPKWRTMGDGSRALRLLFGSQGLRRLQERWDDPAFDSIVKLHRGKGDAISAALEFLATGNEERVTVAYNDAMAEAYALNTKQAQFYADKAAFVFDWCRGVLSSSQRGELVTKIASNIAKRKTSIEGQFQWHEGHYKGFHAWLFGAMSIAGEDGADPDLDRQIARAMQHYVGWENQAAGDGYVMTYPYQDPWFTIVPIAYGLASDQSMRDRALYLASRTEAALRLQSPDIKNTIAMPSHQAAVPPSGYLQGSQLSGAMHHYWIADYMRDDFAQWFANRLKDATGWSRTAAGVDPWWSLLMMMADDLAGDTDPEAAGIPLARAAPVSGVVNSRSGWHADADSTETNALFYVGHIDAHDNPKAGHLQIWRGNDELIAGGSNYFGSPSQNTDEWGHHSYARNCLCFDPLDMSEDADGGQIITDWPRSCEDLPNPIRLLWYTSPEGHTAAGYLIDFRDDGRAVITTGDLSISYRPDMVQRYWRTLIHVRPGIFFLWDRWQCDPSKVARVHARFCSNAEFETADSPAQCIITEGDSRAVIIAEQAGVVVTGGPGAECENAGTNWLCHDDVHYCQDWLPDHSDHDPRVNRLKGQYFVEFEVDPMEGELLLAIVTGAAADQLPDIHLDEDAQTGERVLTVAGAAKVHLPRSSDSRQPWTEAA